MPQPQLEWGECDSLLGGSQMLVNYQKLLWKILVLVTIEHLRAFIEAEPEAAPVRAWDTVGLQLWLPKAG